MKTDAQTRLLWREIGAIVALSILLALVYNYFSSKRLPLIRAATTKVAVNDSLLFAQVNPLRSPVADTVPRREGAPVRGVPVDSTQSSQANNPDRIETVSLRQMLQLLEQHRALVIDARDPESYKKGHIRGAMNVFGDEPGDHFEDLTKLAPDTLVVVYCNGPDCHLGRSLIKFMRVMEFKHLLLYDDGWDGWEKANMPEEK